MRVVVDQLPESPRDCLFSQHHCEYGYLCMLRPLVNTGEDNRRRKPIIRCSGVHECECLVELELASCKSENCIINWEE